MEKIIQQETYREMETSYIDYAMSVIVGRALPDVRDGLKPVQRRILYGMAELGVTPDKPHKKSARIVGEVMGKYHPHGDCYHGDTKVKLLNGKVKTMRELAEIGEEQWVMAVSSDDYQLIPVKAHSFRIGQWADKLYHIEFANGYILTVTGNHPFLTINGDWVKAQDLKPNVILDTTIISNTEPSDYLTIQSVSNKALRKRSCLHSLVGKASSLKPKNGLDDELSNLTVMRLIAKHSGRCNFSHIVTIDEMKNSSGKNNVILRYTNSEFENIRDNSMALIKSISIEECSEKIPMYDFTVDKHENMLLPIDDKCELFCCGHNSSIYDAMARMAQDFSTRYPLVDGHGNFGSVDGDAPASPRYTEARMSPFSLEMIRDIKKNTVDFMPNYDGEETEPVVLPSRVPNLLINGSNGIAVGMATSIPPHNLGEVVDGCIAMIDGDPTIDELCKIIKGPDFPTGAQILGKNEIHEAYRTGQSKITVQGVAKIEDSSRGKSNIIITELPYQVNKAKLLEKISELVRDKKIEGISAIRDESNRKGMRVVIEVKRDANPNIILNRLYKYTALQDTYGITMLTLVDGEPKVLSLKKILAEYLKHQKEVVTRRTQFDLEKAEARAHILEGYKIAQANIDEVVKIIRTSTNDAKERLIKKFLLSEIQAQAILELKLGRLQKLEVEKIEKEYKELVKQIRHYKALLKSEKKLMDVVKSELLEVKERWGDKRRTAIKKAEDDLDETDLVEEKEVVITVTNQGYVKRVPADAYKAQSKGGKGIQGTSMRADDFVTDIITASTHDTLLFFTSIGKMYSLKAYEIPESTRTAKGIPAINFLGLVPREKITAVLPRKDNSNTFLLGVTKKGLVKKTAMSEYSVTKKGTIAIKVKTGDELIAIRETTGKEKVILVTKQGKSIAFSEEEIRPMGRIAGGVRGIELDKGDEVVSAEVVLPKETLVVVTSKGYAKKTTAGEYRLQARGGRGKQTYDPTKFDKTGFVVGAITANIDDELLFVNADGIVLKVKANDIKTVGKRTMGGKVMETDADIVAVAKSVKENSQMQIQL